MPVYEYECQGCGTHFERRQKFSDSPVAECPDCGGAVRKLISATAFTLKGGGWYTEGYGVAKPATADTPTPCAAKSGGDCANCPAAAA